MNKKEFIEEISKRLGISIKGSQSFIDIFIDIVKEKMKEDEKIILSGFGNFEILKSKPRIGTNPKTAEKINIPAKNYAKFRFSKSFNELIN